MIRIAFSLVALCITPQISLGQGAPPIEMEADEESVDESAEDLVPTEVQPGESPADAFNGEEFASSRADEIAISDGTRIDVKDFSIKPPAGWEIHRNRAKLSLMLQIPFQDDMPYQRTIQVAVRNDPMFIDEATAKDFEEQLIKQFTKYDAAIQNYRVRNNRVIEMTDGRPALLFYSDFLYETTPLMQAHILISNKERHYLLSFTDVAEHFEGEGSEPLDVAWNSMTSARISGTTPIRFEELYWVFGIALLITVLGGSIAVFNRIRGKKKMEGYSRGLGFDDEDEVEEVTDGSGVEVEFVSVARRKRGRKQKAPVSEYSMEAPISAAHTASSQLESGFVSNISEVKSIHEQSPVKKSAPASSVKNLPEPPQHPPVPTHKVAEHVSEAPARVNELPPAPNPDQMSFHFGENLADEAKKTSMRSIHELPDNPNRTQVSQIASVNVDESYVSGLDDEVEFDEDEEDAV